MSGAEWHPEWCALEHTANSHRGAHKSESCWVAANTNRVEVGLYLGSGRWAITWVVVTSESKVLMFSPAEARRLGQVLVRLADEAFVAEVP